MWQTIQDWKLILKIACTILLNNIIVLKTVIERIIYFSGLLISFYFLRHFVIWPMYRQNNIPASLFFTAKFNCSLFEGVFPLSTLKFFLDCWRKESSIFCAERCLGNGAKRTLYKVLLIYFQVLFVSWPGFRGFNKLSVLVCVGSASYSNLTFYFHNQGLKQSLLMNPNWVFWGFAQQINVFSRIWCLMGFCCDWMIQSWP